MKRRNFLIGTAVAAGGLAIGYRVWTNSFEAQAAALVTARRRQPARRLGEDRAR